MSKPQLVLCTTPDQQSASSLAAALVEQRLAACVNIVPGLQSVYEWQGKIEHSEEFLMLIKTTSQAYPALESALSKLHPYDTPEIIAFDMNAGLPDYLQWISKAVG